MSDVLDDLHALADTLADAVEPRSLSSIVAEERRSGPPPARRPPSAVLVGAAIAVLIIMIAAGVAIARRTDPGVTVTGIGSIPSASDDATANAIEGREYWSVAITEHGTPRTLVTTPVAATAPRLSLAFDHGTMIAYAGCNRMGVSIAVDQGHVVPASVGMSITQMLCGSGQEQDQWYAQFLLSHPAIAVNGDRLALSNPDVTIVFVDRHVADPDRPLLGTDWNLTGIVTGQTTSSPTENGRGLVRFDPPEQPGAEAFVLIHPGCNPYRRSFVQDGNILRFGPPGYHTMMGCSGTAATEAAMTAVFGDQATFSITGSTLTVTHGESSLTFDAAATAPSNPPGTQGQGPPTSTVPNSESTTWVKSVPTSLGPGLYIIEKPGPSHESVAWAKFSRLDDARGLVDRETAVRAAQGSDSSQALSAATVESASLVLYSDPEVVLDSSARPPASAGTIPTSDGELAQRPAWIITFKTMPYDATNGAAGGPVVVTHYLVVVDAQSGSTLRGMPVT